MADAVVTACLRVVLERTEEFLSRRTEELLHEKELDTPTREKYFRRSQMIGKLAKLLEKAAQLMMELELELDTLENEKTYSFRRSQCPEEQIFENNDECRKNRFLGRLNDGCWKNGNLKVLYDPTDACGYGSCFKNDYDLLRNQRCLNGTRSELSIQTLWNLKHTTRNKFLQDNNKSNDTNWNGEMTLPLLVDKSTFCMLNKDEEVDKPFSPGKRMKTAQCVLSFLIATIASLWILTDVCSMLSIIKLQPEHGPLFIWFSLLEPVGFMVFVCAVAAMIVIGAPFSRLLSAILLFWGIWLLVRSSKSLTALCLPILGILLMVWHLCSWKSSCQMKGNEQGSEAPKIKPMCFTSAA